MRRELGPLASALLLGLFIVSVSSLAASLRLIDTSKLVGVSSVLLPSLPTLQQPGQFAGEAESGSLSWLVLAVASVSLLVIVFLARRRRLAGGEGSFWRLMGTLLGAAMIVGLVELFSSFSSLRAAGIDQEFVLATVILSFAAVLAMGSIIAALVWLERSKVLHKSASLEGGSSARGVQRFLESMRQRIYSMPPGEVYRDSVIACYSEMIRLLAGYGAGDRPSFTPQELEASASGKLTLAQADIHLLTRLFEKARYADAQITKREAQGSVDALERMTNEVAARTVPVGIT